MDETTTRITEKSHFQNDIIDTHGFKEHSIQKRNVSFQLVAIFGFYNRKLRKATLCSSLAMSILIHVFANVTTFSLKLTYSFKYFMGYSVYYITTHNSWLEMLKK